MTRRIDTPEPPPQGAKDAQSAADGQLDDLVSALRRAVARKRTNGSEDTENRP